jgi:hypothetical protein
MRWFDRRKSVFLVHVLMVLTIAGLLVGSPTTAEAAPAEKLITQTAVSYVAPDGSFGSTMVLKFDTPQSSTRVMREMTSRQPTGVLQAQLGPQNIDCEGSGNWSDSNGKLSLQYTCNSSRRTGYLAWGYRISSGVKAIITGGVSERGLSWWRNGVAMPSNAPHPGVSKDYVFHGTMTGANSNMDITYQDYLTFRHNVGGGGTGSIAWAGKVHTRGGEGRCEGRRAQVVDDARS